MIKTFNAYKPVKFNKNEDFLFYVHRGSSICNLCKKSIGYEEVCFSFNYLIRLHLSCMEEFKRQFEQFSKQKSKELVIEMLKR